MKTWPPAFILCVPDARSLSGFLRSAKERLVLAIAMLATFQLYGQGTVSFSNLLKNAPVYNSATCLDAIAGTTFSVALYSAPYDPANPVPPDPATMMQAGASASLYAAGIYFAGIRTASNITPPGSLSWFHLRHYLRASADQPRRAGWRKQHHPGPDRQSASRRAGRFDRDLWNHALSRWHAPVCPRGVARRARIPGSGTSVLLAGQKPEPLDGGAVIAPMPCSGFTKTHPSKC